MTKKEIINLFIEGIACDAWCQECAVENSMKALYKVLKAEKLELPRFLLYKHEKDFLEEGFDRNFFESWYINHEI